MIKSRDKGYTLVELAFSMTIVAFVVSILAASLVNIMQSYNKGVWLSQINQAGRMLSRDIGGQAKYSGVSTSQVIPDKQRLCIGGVSYLWNTQAQIDNKSVVNRFSETSAPTLRLVRIDDANASYCTNLSLNPPYSGAKVRNLLGSGVSLYEFSAKQNTTTSGAKIPLLSIDIVVGTKGFDRPIKVRDTVNYKIVSDDASGVWQCGTWYDYNKNNKVDSRDGFEPSQNQRCAVLQFKYILYERVQSES